MYILAVLVMLIPAGTHIETPHSSHKTLEDCQKAALSALEEVTRGTNINTNYIDVRVVCRKEGN